MTSSAEWARSYTERLGWALISMPAGTKGPTQPGWNKPERALVDPAAAESYWTSNPTHNMGLLHSASGTVVLDIDSVANTRLIFDELGINYDDIMASVPRIVGRADRGKALFRAPAGSDLKTHKISWPVEGDPRRTEVVFELRAGPVQDVLPPSVHPDTGNPYTWAGPSVFDGIPELPHQLRALWENWDRLRPQLMDICPWKPKREFTPARKPRVVPERSSVIGAFNDAHDMDGLLRQFGYRPTARGRYLSPNSTSGLAGVVLFDDGKAYSHHASDPFDSAHTFDAFDLWCQYEHMGDVSKAVKAAADFLNVTQDTAHEYDADAIAHGASVASVILAKPANAAAGPLDDIPEHLLSVPGVLQDAVNYYNTTAPKDQPQFAVQAALAFGSVVMGRRWVTDQKNYSGLYFIIVGKSAAGKEHAKTVTERLLEAAGLDRLIGPSGYTSSAGVFSALVQQPTQISIIDELGRVLQSSQAAGNHNKTDAQTILMEVFGRQASTLRPQGYSKMGLTSKQSAEFDKVVRSPSLTVLAMTTPSTLYENLSSRYVSDGFLGRFLIVESHIGRQVSRITRDMAPSERLCLWAQECAAGNGGDMPHSDIFDIPPAPATLPFSDACRPHLVACDAAMMGHMDAFERHGMEAMFGRTKEIAQRLSLIVARSKGEVEISPDSLKWAVDYASFYALRTVSALRKTMSDGPFEAACKAVFAKIEAAGLKGITARELSRSVKIFTGLDPKKRKDVLDALVEDKGIECRNQNPSGRPSFAWFAPPECQ